MQRLPEPYGHTSLRKHNVFDTPAREVHFYATSWVQPVVHPMVPCERFPGSSWVGAAEVFDCLPNTFFQNYIRIVCAHTNEYQPHSINSNLPKELWQFTECDECGRKPWEDCMAMGSQVGTGGDCHLACVYCSTYRAIEDFLNNDTKWFDMLQLGGQEMESQRATISASINLILIWLNGAITNSVETFQGRNHGQLPPMMRRTWVYATHGGHIWPR